MTYKSKRKNPSSITQRQQRKRELAYRVERSKTKDKPEGSNRAIKKSMATGNKIW